MKSSSWWPTLLLQQPSNNFYHSIIIAKTVWNIRIFTLWNWEKHGCHFMIQASHKNNCENCHASVCSNSLSYVSAKYYLNWFTVGEVIAKIKGRTSLKDTVQYPTHSLWPCQYRFQNTLTISTLWQMKDWYSVDENLYLGFHLVVLLPKLWRLFLWLPQVKNRKKPCNNKSRKNTYKKRPRVGELFSQ